MTTPEDPADPTPPEEPARPTPPGVGTGTVIAFLLGGLVFLSIAVVALVFVNKDGDANASTSDLHTNVLPEGMPRPDVTLTDQNGQPYDLGAETSGQLTLVFFGYTNCPDVCPLTMGIISEALDNAQVAAKVVFITTDPARDTPERLKEWLGDINPDFIGLTGSRDEVIAAQNAFNITVAVPEDPDPKGNYAVGHAAQVFVFTPDDQAHLLYPWGTRLDDWSEDLPKIAANDDWQAPDGSPDSGTGS